MHEIPTLTTIPLHNDYNKYDLVLQSSMVNYGYIIWIQTSKIWQVKEMSRDEKLH